MKHNLAKDLLINSRLGDTKERIHDLEDRIMEITQSEQQKEKQIFKNENSLKHLRDNNKHTNICIIGAPEGEDRKGSKMHLRKLWLKCSKPEEGNIYPGTGSAEGPKQDKPKQTHTKTYHS